MVTHARDQADRPPRWWNRPTTSHGPEGIGRPPDPTVRDGLVRKRVMVTVVDNVTPREVGYRGIVDNLDHTGMMLVAGAGAPLEYIDEKDQATDLGDDGGRIFIPADRIKFVQIWDRT